MIISWTKINIESKNKTNFARKVWKILSLARKSASKTVKDFVSLENFYPGENSRKKSSSFLFRNFRIFNFREFRFSRTFPEMLEVRSKH